MGGTVVLIHLVEKFESVSNRVIYVVLKLSKRYKFQVIQTYAPTSTADDDSIRTFYQDIDFARQAKKAHFVLEIEDLNAKTDIETESKSEFVGKFGIGLGNDRGDRLINYLDAEKLYFVNSFFKKPAKRRWTWRNPNCKIKNEIDYMISNHKRVMTDVSVLNNFNTGGVSTSIY